MGWSDSVDERIREQQEQIEGLTRILARVLKPQLIGKETQVRVEPRSYTRTVGRIVAVNFESVQVVFDPPVAGDYWDQPKIREVTVNLIEAVDGLVEG